MRRLRALVFVLAGCGPDVFLPAPEAPIAEEGFTELSHDVDVRFHRGEAHLVVTRTFRNTGPDVDELSVSLYLPEAGVVNAFRVGDGLTWGEAALSDAEEAFRRYAGLTGHGQKARSLEALLEHAGDAQVDLRAWPVAPGESVSVQYDVRAPAHYAGGQWHLEYPHGDVEPRLVLAPGVVAEPVDGATHLRLDRPLIDELEARWATYDLGDRSAWRLEIAAAGELGSVPTRPHVVFAIDASHSMRPAGVQAQIDVVEGFLAHVPGAEVEVIVFRRSAERLFGRYIAAADAMTRLRSAVIPCGNGSHLDEAVREAATLRPDRLVLFTDEQLRQAFDAVESARLLEVLPRDAIVHVVSRDPTGRVMHEQRLFENPLEPLARNGVVLKVLGTSADPAERAQVALGLVRPIRIDALTVEAIGMEQDRIDAPGELPEGEGIDLTALAERVPPSVTVRGLIWSRPIERVVHADGDLVEQLPALLIGDGDLLAQLSEAEERQAAAKARAVSPSFSYLYAPPGAEPSEMFEIGGTRCLGLRGFGTGSGCRLSGRAVVVDLMPELKRLLLPLADRCLAQGASVRVETTGDEIVDVEATGPNAGCLAESIWATRLPESFRRTSAQYQLRL